MKKPDLFLNAVGETDSRYLVEVELFLNRRRSRRIAAITAVASVAAMLVLVMGVSLVIHLFVSWGGNANYGLDGAVGGGYFYYEFPYDGIYRYEPGKSPKKIVDTNGRPWYEFVVNDDALYYTRWENSADYDKTIYRIEHGSDTAQGLFRDDDAKCIDLITAVSDRELVICIQYDNDTRGFGDREVIIDAKTGEIKEEISSFFILEDKALSESIMYSDIDLDEQYEMTHRETSYENPRITYTVGDRTILAEKNDHNWYDLIVNGEKIDEIVDPVPQKMLGGSLVFGGNVTVEPTVDSPDSLPKFHYQIVRPDETQDGFSLENVGELQGNDTYVYYIDDDDRLIAFNTRTSKSDVLMYEKELSFSDLYSDGEYIYLSRYNGEGILKKQNHPMRCYRILYDSDGRPQSLTLIDNNINN